MHSNVRFRGRSIDELTREEAIDALRQALARVKEMEGHHIPVIYGHEPCEGGGGQSRFVDVENAPYIVIKPRVDWTGAA